MRRIYQIRLANARALAEIAGNAQLFGERLDMSKQQVSQIIGSRPIRMIGDDIAERIERVFKRPHEWLDTDHSEPLLEMVAKLTPENKTAVVDLVKALLVGQRAKTR